MINIHIHTKTIVWIIVLLLVNFTQLPAYSNQANSKQVHFIQPAAKEPENRGAPSDRKGAGNRSNYTPTNKPLTGLEPLMTKAPGSKYVLGMTEAEHSTF